MQNTPQPLSYPTIIGIVCLSSIIAILILLGLWIVFEPLIRVFILFVEWLINGTPGCCPPFFISL
jgi:hypothetical protein